MDDSTGTISIAMEFCEGGSLDSIYREVKKLGGRTGEKVLGKVAEGVLHGLTYLNNKKIIHRGTNGLAFCGLATHDHYRYKTLQHTPLPRWPSQALRFLRE